MIVPHGLQLFASVLESNSDVFLRVLGDHLKYHVVRKWRHYQWNLHLDTLVFQLSYSGRPIILPLLPDFIKLSFIALTLVEWMLSVPNVYKYSHQVVNDLVTGLLPFQLVLLQLFVKEILAFKSFFLQFFTKTFLEFRNRKYLIRQERNSNLKLLQ